MPIISAVEAQVRDRTRCSVFIDGKFYCGLKTETAVKYGIKPGAYVEDGFLDKVQAESEKTEALEKALRHMSLSLKTEKEMRDFLKRKGYTDAVTDYCLDRLREYGYVDDTAYCEEYIRCRKNDGLRKVRSSLRRRGIPAETAEKALEGFEEDPGALDRVLERYMRGKTYDAETRRKCINYLLSRGFSYDNVRGCVKRAFDGRPDGEDD